MKRTSYVAGFALAAALGLAGCAQTYTITLNNGSTVTSKGRPKLERGYYVYKDTKGQEQRVNELRVREISAD